MQFSWQSSLRSRARSLAWLQAGLLLVAMLFVLLQSHRNALSVARKFDPSPWDGTYQLLNSLRRLTEGFQLGGDFQVFHGPLWSLPEIPAFILSQGNLATVEYAKVFLNSSAIPLTAGILVILWMRDARFRLALAALTVAVLDVLQPTEWLYLFSSLGQRISEALLILLCAAITIRSRSLRMAITSGFLAGALTTMCIDQAVYAWVAIGLCFAIFLVRSRFTRDTLACLLAFTTGAIVAFASLILILTRFDHSAFASVITFYFRDIPADQKWFFGSWPAASTTKWSQLFDAALLAQTSLTLFALILICIVAVRTRIRGLALPALLATYSLLTQWSYLSSYRSPHYLVPGQVATLVALLLVCFEAINHTSRSAAANSPSMGETRKWISLILVFGFVCTLMPAIAMRSTSLSSVNQAYMNTLETSGVQCGDGIHDLWSSYPSLFQASHDCFTPVGDLMIHAVGTRRNEYSEAFSRTKPLWVETARGDSLEFEPWLRTSNSDFYQTLYTWYDPYTSTDRSIIWRRRLNPNNWMNRPALDFAIQPPASQLEAWTLESPTEKAVAFVTVDYTVTVPGILSSLTHSMNLVEAHLFNSIPANQVVGLPPISGRSRFPILSEGDKHPVFIRFNLAGLVPSGKLSVSAVHVAWYIPPSVDNWNLVFGQFWAKGA